MPPKKKEGKQKKDDRDGRKGRPQKRVPVQIKKVPVQIPDPDSDADPEQMEDEEHIEASPQKDQQEGALADEELHLERGFMGWDREREIARFFEAHPLFWDPCNEEYKNKSKRQGILREFAESIGLTREYPKI